MSSRTLATTALLLALLPASPRRGCRRPPSSRRPQAPASRRCHVLVGPVRKAAHYEFQLAADRKFASIVTGKGMKTNNTAATLTKAIPTEPYWRVRAVSTTDTAGRWSAVRTLTKAWTTPPVLENLDGLVAWPALPPVLRWSTAPHSMSTSLRSRPTRSSRTSCSAGSEASGDRRHRVRPPDCAAARQVLLGGHSGGRTGPQGRSLRRVCRVGGFVHLDVATERPPGSPTLTPTRASSTRSSRNQIPGAAKYEVEINSAQDFPPNAKWCCTDRVIGTSVSPVTLLANNTYYWRVRGVDPDGNAGQWNVGPEFERRSTRSRLRSRASG